MAKGIVANVYFFSFTSTKHIPASLKFKLVNLYQFQDYSCFQGNVRKSRGSDAAIFERQSSAVDEDVDGDEKNREEEEEEKQEDDVQEVILYPEGDTSADEW